MKDKIINNLLEKMEKNSAEVLKMNKKIKDIEKENQSKKKTEKNF